MSFFENLRGESVDYPPPSRVYAWVDGASEESGDGYTRLDCVDADWAEQAEFRALADPEVTIEAEPRVSMILWREWTEVAEEGRVVELTLGDSAAGLGKAPALHFLNLEGPAIPRDILDVRWPDRDEAAKIAKITDIGDEIADEGDIAAVLAEVPSELDAVAVYDVGQGACCGLIADNYPRLYFDMGRGALADAATFPGGLSAICTTARPPVVLSHWHYDHWGLVKRFGGAILESPWIVPYQSNLRPTAATLLGLLRSSAGALVCPSGMSTLRVGAVSLHDCAGATMNDSGIAMVVWDAEERSIVLPGDARYKYIVDLPGSPISLVASHHGGNTRATVGEIPSPNGDAAGRLVFSCGPANSYGHPLRGPLTAHVEAGWSPCRQLSTGARRSSSNPEHIHLYWDADQDDVGMGCGGVDCALAPCRR